VVSRPPACLSAERSEARAGWRRLLSPPEGAPADATAHDRVASPLVMAATHAPGAFRLQSEGPSRVRCRHYPCCAGVVPHDTSCDLPHYPLRLRCAPPSSATPSAERSEARASWRRLRQTYRVASPLVMAAPHAPGAPRLQSEGSSCVRGRHYPCCAGVVPHDTSATSHTIRSGFAALRLRRRQRCPCVPKRGAKRSASKLATTSPNVSCGITSGDGGIERAGRATTAV